MEQRRGNVSAVWAWLSSYDIGQDYAGRLFGDVQVAVMPKLVEHTPDELNALVRTMSFYARLSPAQRQALAREHEAIYERLGRPIRASTVVALVTAPRSTEGDEHGTSPRACRPDATSSHRASTPTTPCDPSASTMAAHAPPITRSSRTSRTRRRARGPSCG
jgi:hypothetical protein